MKLKNITALFSLLLLLLLISAYKIISNGDELLNKITTKFNNYTAQSPQEKVYLHFDKPYYMAGETMWFKGYLFDAQVHGIDSISRVLYVDLMNTETKTLVKHLILKCSSGTTNGEIKLSETLAEGTYSVRAYTIYMRNYSEDFFFKQDIKIWQNKPTATSNEQDQKAQSTVAECTFFPEGGNLVSGILSRVGFKAVNKFGRGVDIQGIVLEDNKDTLTYFKSERLGMGMLSFMPKFGKKYIAKVKNLDGSYTDLPMPQIYENGYVMLVDNISNKNNVKIYIHNSQPQVTEKLGEMVVIGQQRSKICFTAKIPNTKKIIPLSIARSAIPDDGIVQITLFNTEGTPICERIIFIKKQEQQFNLKLIVGKTTYKPREKVTLTVEATDSLGKPIEGNFSLTATDSKQVTPLSVGTPMEQYQNNILSFLLLTSDLKGYIEEPAYYFTPKDFNALRHLDYLMMTQGWRRFVWQDVMADRYPRLDYMLEQGLAVKGRVVRYNKKASPNAKMTLFLKPQDNKAPMLTIGECDSSGRFGFYNLNFQDTCQILVQAVKPKGGRALDIVLDSIALPKVLRAQSPNNLMFYDNKILAEFLKRTAETLEFERKIKLNEDRMLNTVEVKAKRVEKADIRRMYGNNGKSIKMTDQDCIHYTTVFNIIEQQVPGIRIIQDGFDFTATSRGGELSFAIDGIITDNGFISSIQPCDMEAVDVLRGADAAFFGMQAGSGGVVNILTKMGSPNYTGSASPVPGIITTRRIGYVIAKEFYAPRYDVSKPEHDLPDFRSTLHWQPHVKTDVAGKAKIEFWNSDAKTKVQVQVEGFSKTGRVAVGKLEYEVQ